MYGKKCRMMMPPLIHIKISKEIEHENIEREDDNTDGSDDEIDVQIPQYREHGNNDEQIERDNTDRCKCC